MNITEKIKTFEDACVQLGIDAKQWLAENERKDKDVIAYLKLGIIAEALNEGWKPSFTVREYRYCPYFRIYTKAEVDTMNNAMRKRLWLFGGCSDVGSHCGLAYSGSGVAWSYAHSNLSARLSVKSGDLARYFGEQFIGIWADYLFHTQD